MQRSYLTRRGLLRSGLTSAAAGLVLISSPEFVYPDEQEGEELVPFLDMPPAPPHRLDWETNDSWLTPQDQVFNVEHYGIPEFDIDSYQLEITGLVDRPKMLTLDQIKEFPRRNQLMTLECAGNGASKGFSNAVYNSEWTGTALAPLLDDCGIKPNAREVVFFGYDNQEETLRKGTNRELTVEVPFGRSIDLPDAMSSNLLLAYERNGKPIEHRNGAPVRLIIPGWYGIANVKWLRRIELRDRRYMGRYMAREYVTVRGEQRGDEVVYVETSVARMNLKSIVARVTRKNLANGSVSLKAYGAAWSDGTEVKRVEVQLDTGSWREAQLAVEPRAKFCWVFFSIDLGTVMPGKHTVVSRAIDANGRLQPTADDDEIALKRTYWEAYQQWPREIEI